MEGSEASKLFDKMQIDELAKKNCRKCFGRGYWGKDDKNNPVVCPCIYKKVHKAKENNIDSIVQDVL